MPISLTYGFTAFNEIEKYIEENEVPDDYTLDILDMMSCDGSIFINVTKNDFLRVIKIVTSMEHDYPRWIGIDDIHKKVVVGLWFTRGNLDLNRHYDFVDGMLQEEAR